MLSEQAREKFILRHREHYGSMVIDEVDVDVNGLLEAQHKADLLEFQKQKQEMWNEIVGRPIMISEGTKKCEDFKHKWGIE